MFHTAPHPLWLALNVGPDSADGAANSAKGHDGPLLVLAHELGHEGLQVVDGLLTPRSYQHWLCAWLRNSLLLYFVSTELAMI